MVATATSPDEATSASPGGPTRAAGRRWGTVALALAVAVGLLLGYAGGWLTPRLTRPGDTSAEAGFARDMTTHHTQAVQMALVAFKYGQDPAVTQLGVDIATGQQGEIGIMQTWLRQWQLDPTGSEPPMAWMPDGEQLMREGGLMPGMATKEEMDKLEAARGHELDVLFVTLMINHHLGGIHMVDAILDRSGNDQVTEAAQRMKNTQQGEIANMRSILSRIQ
ncbi:DUF305 domain-containing protein [Phytohabitans sp. ZYX-F-186]|uniref:DUF305 domain-containing protein n=1 Tax=Phytohabitans maris TaxID=3071409 RepID=A0ABU0ZI69_9ACTN|nr:DUF305 domain-containing protein [Phytohabitans sp. ZYX-F-186]MDQ7905647.1 DUF305 domain-containing protein [Phytohabitans sp. ZYX-F-186]